MSMSMSMSMSTSMSIRVLWITMLMLVVAGNTLFVLSSAFVLPTSTSTRTSTCGYFTLAQQPQQPQQPQHQQYQRQPVALFSTPIATIHGNVDNPSTNEGNGNSHDRQQTYRHGLAILTMPTTSLDKIANEAILDTALKHTSHKLSVVLRASEDNPSPSLASLRKSVGDVYSTLWDYHMGEAVDDNDNSRMCEVVVYPQNLPNAPPEQWLHHLPDLDCVCSHDSICGWDSKIPPKGSTGTRFYKQEGNGVGGLQAHVQAINMDRQSRKLSALTALSVDPWPAGACAKFNEDHNVVFMDDEQLDDASTNLKRDTPATTATTTNEPTSTTTTTTPTTTATLLGGAVIHSKHLYSSVAVGGTFDGMHYGHCKLLTLAISSVLPQTGKLLIGVTIDEMLQHKQYADYIPPLQERMEGVRRFVHRLAPGMKNRIHIIPISDPYGPPGHNSPEGADIDALVLSHETLQNGHELNLHRIQNLGFEPLVLLCTRRTEPHGMSSTALRRFRSETAQRKSAALLAPPPDSSADAA